MQLPSDKRKNILRGWRFIRHLLPLLFLLGLFAPYAVGEATSTRVLILPFEVRASGETDYLRTQIASVLAEHLEGSGATRISLTETDLADLINALPGEETLRQMAVRYQADQVIWGSFTLIGESFSLDARMVNPKGSEAPMTFSAQGRGLENLPNVLKKLAGKIGRQLFKYDIVDEVRVQGNQRLETDAILRSIQTKAGGIFQPNSVTQDLRAIYAMGWFDDVRVEAESGKNGKIVTFHVKEKPVIRRVKLKGNLLINDEKIKENLTIRTGTVLNNKKIRNNIEQIELMYKDKNYHDIKVDYRLYALKKNQADIEFIIVEGDKYYITEINFEGNMDFDDRKLKKIISTSEKGFFYWISSSGDFDRTRLDQDTALLKQFYHNKGYIRARVGAPEIYFQPEGIRVTFKIEEGPQFKVGKVDIRGDLLPDFNKAEYIENLKINKTTYFSREKIREDITDLKDLYGSAGYAYADVRPLTVQKKETLTVDITFQIDKRTEVFFENITISGNTRTRDKVIRRQLRIVEQTRFNGKALKRSVRNLHRLGFFEDIKVDTTKGSEEDQMDVTIEVTEKPTGMFSFGAGYSSEENFFLAGEISENNLFGRGQILKLNAMLGGSTTQYTLSFTEPWLFDTPLSTTVSVYDEVKEYTNEYDRHSIGGGLRFGYPLFDYTRGYLGYAYEWSDISIVDEDNVNDDIIVLEGENITSSVSLAVLYDSRDSRLNPSEGSKHSVSFEYAGLGGDIGFNKYKAETGWYWPLYKGLVGLVHAKYGYVHKNSDDLVLPDYEKFYLGGINSLRGFDYRDVHLTKLNSNDEEVKAGGDYMMQLNLELIFPISKNAGLMGVVFFDTGNVYEDGIDFHDRRSSIGGGFRWFSALAPMRLEYGRIFDPRDGEEDGRWEFTLGGAF